jgi:membrane protein implicated in regulation of membrane protease activity
MTYKYWLIATVVFVILEILPPPTHFFFVCLAFGSLAGAICAVFAAPVWMTWGSFAVVSVALTPLLIPLAKFIFATKPHPSNVDAILGQKALVLDPIDPKQAGTIKVGSETWRAVSHTDHFEKHEWVEVAKVEGTSAIIRRIL